MLFKSEDSFINYECKTPLKPYKIDYHLIIPTDVSFYALKFLPIESLDPLLALLLISPFLIFFVL